MNTRNNEKKLIAVIGTTGQQGGGVVRALHASGQFKVRALSRDPSKHRDLADEVVEADLNRPETLKGAFEDAHGVFLVTNFQDLGEAKQVPAELFATFFPGAAEIAEMFSYFQTHTCLGSDSTDRIALANETAGKQPIKFSTWARLNLPIRNP